MERWILPIIAIAVLSLTLSALSRLITQRTGRTKYVEGPWSLVVPVGVFVSVIGASFLSLDLPWLAVTAGVSAGIIGLCVQGIAGRKLPEAVE